MGAGFMARTRRGGRTPSWLGPTVLLALAGFFIGVVIWGGLNPADIRVVYFDAGRADSFTIGQVTAFPDQDVYVVGLEDGRLRAIDARVADTDCVAEWLPDDDRGRAYNPRGAPGVFQDPCSGATWSMLANAIQGADEPLRTPHIDYRPGPDGRATHAYVERINP